MSKCKSNKKRKQKNKFPLSVIIVLIILVLIVAGSWAYFHPHEAQQYVKNWIEQVQDRPSHIVIPVPTTGDYDNLVFGIPGQADVIINREGYALGYSDYHEQATWVIYRMTREEAIAKIARREDNFREDPEITTGSATLADYRGSGYDRGHLAPAADMSFSIKTMDESFYMSNMSPQRPAFNRGAWKRLEEQVRSFAITEGDVYVVTGPVLPQKKSLTIGASQVTVPGSYYKVVWDRTEPQKMIGFLLKNDDTSKSLQTFAVSVDEVERVTGLDFFNLLPQPQQEQLESTLTVDAWKW